MKHLPTLVGAALLALTSGCAVTPVYQVPPNTETAKLNTRSLGNKWICVAGRAQRLVPDSTGYVEIPAGKPVTLGASYFNYVYGGVSTSCNPRSTIVPVAGQRYFIDFEIEAERCTALIFREDPRTRTGLAWDLSFGQTPAECSSR
jgi:hypothetical protein